MRTIQEVVESANTIQTEIEPGIWAPAQPIPSGVLLYRIRDAWAVFTGQADAVIYPEHPGESPGPCTRRLLGLLPKRHRWEEVEHTKKYSYQQCSKAGCRVRRIVELFPGGYQAFAHGWSDVPIVNGDRRRL